MFIDNQKARKPTILRASISKLIVGVTINGINICHLFIGINNSLIIGPLSRVLVDFSYIGGTVENETDMEVFSALVRVSIYTMFVCVAVQCFEFTIQCLSYFL